MQMYQFLLDSIQFLLLELNIFISSEVLFGADICIYFGNLHHYFLQSCIFLLALMHIFPSVLNYWNQIQRISPRFSGSQIE